jgi:CzcA family heavy metal efflux pump
MTAAILRNGRAIWLAVLLLTLGGLFAGSRLPVALFPQIDYPRVVVSVDAGDRDAAQMAAGITRPIEIALRAVPGVTGIRSITSRGSAEVSLNFDWGSDMVAAKLATQSALATILTDLPTGTRFDVRHSDPTIFPVLGLSLTSKSRDTRSLRQLAELKLRPLLTPVPGVAGVDILGGSAREIAVEVDPARLQAMALTLADVAQSLSSANTIKAVGKIEDRHRLYLTLVEDRIGNIKELAATPIKTGSAAGAGVVTLGQIAIIKPSEAPSFTRVTANGEDAVLINVRQSPSADSVRLVQQIDARLASAKLPQGVVITPFYDQSELVSGAANAVRDAILLGALLAGAVLFVFLRSGRLMLITGLMLPAVLGATCLALYAFGMSFNMMTLGGMAASVGLIVDDAVVMLEHMMRRMQDGTASSFSDRLGAAAEMAKPLLGSTAATIIVFLPLAFVSGVTGGFFKALAVTMAAALFVSLLYARFVIPLIAAHWLRPTDAEAADRAGHMMNGLADRYDRLTRRAWERPGAFVMSAALLLSVLGYAGYARVESGFMPKMDEGGFILDYKAKPGAALTDTDQLLRQIEAIVRATPEVASYSRRTGVQLGGGLTEADEGDMFIRLKGGSRRDIETVMSEIRGKIEAQVPGLTIETLQLMEDLIGDLTAVPQPIEVKLFSDDPAQLAAAARQTAAALEKIPGVVEVNNGLRVAGDAIVVRVDRAAAALAGLNPDDVATQAQASIGGTIATQMLNGETLIDVRVRTPADLRERVTLLGALPLRSADGRAVALRQLATISVAAGQKQLTREDLAPFVPVTARLDGRDLGSAMKDVRATVADLGLPRSVRTEFGGIYVQQQKSFADLATVFVAALLLTALLLTILFGRWRMTFAALATILLSAAAVLAGLWLSGTELDISALMGLTMVVGMVTELVIFFLAEINPDQPLDVAAMREAGLARLRPILMSALIAILTLLPLALGIGRGAGLQKPLATAIIFGLLVGAPLVLTFLPAALLVRRLPPGVSRS